MSKLLNAEFSRLFKSKIFWSCASVPLAAAVFMMWQKEWRFEQTFDLAYAFFNGGLTVIFCSAIFSAIFFSGGETVRNKIIVGHKKSSVYFSNVIISVTAAFIFQLLYTLPVLILSLTGGVGFSENTVLPSENAAEFLLGSGDALLYKIIETLAMIAMAAIFALIMTLIRKNVVGAVISIMMIFGLTILDEQLYTQVRVVYSTDVEQVFDENGELSEESFKDGAVEKIAAFQLARDFTPVGQMKKISMAYLWFEQPETPDIMPYITLGEFFLINAAGAFAFKRKDIK